jgi:hypothetical protein
MTSTALAPTPTTRPVRRAGAWCLAAGIVGAIQAGIVLAWPEQVPEARFSYPFSGLGFGIAQASFFLQHLPLIAGLAALWRLQAVRASRVAWSGMLAATLGMAVLTVNELITITAHGAATDSDQATLVNNLYGPPVMLIGIGLAVAGAALLRQGATAWTGARWMPALVLLLGLYVFIPLTPAIMGTFTAGRVGIGGWLLGFAALGYGLTRLTDDATVRSRS